MCRGNQWTGFYMITTSVMKELRKVLQSCCSILRKVSTMKERWRTMENDVSKVTLATSTKIHCLLPRFLLIIPAAQGRTVHMFADTSHAGWECAEQYDQTTFRGHKPFYENKCLCKAHTAYDAFFLIGHETFRHNYWSWDWKSQK